MDISGVIPVLSMSTDLVDFQPVLITAKLVLLAPSWTPVHRKLTCHPRSYTGFMQMRIQERFLEEVLFIVL